MHLRNLFWTFIILQSFESFCVNAASKCSVSNELWVNGTCQRCPDNHKIHVKPSSEPWKNEKECIKCAEGHVNPNGTELECKSNTSNPDVIENLPIPPDNTKQPFTVNYLTIPRTSTTTDTSPNYMPRNTAAPVFATSGHLDNVTSTETASTSLTKNNSTKTNSVAESSGISPTVVGILIGIVVIAVIALCVVSIIYFRKKCRQDQGKNYDAELEHLNSPPSNGTDPNARQQNGFTGNGAGIMPSNNSNGNGAGTMPPNSSIGNGAGPVQQNGSATSTGSENGIVEIEQI